MSNSKIKILVLSDSLALSRSYPELCVFEKCWPQLFEKSGEYRLHQVSLGGATIDEISFQATYHVLFDPDIVVLQAGIVDAAPRSLSKYERLRIAKVPFVGNSILNACQRNKIRLRKWRKISYTKIDAFEENAIAIHNLFPNATVFALGIVPAQVGYEKTVPGISKQVALYNAILKKVFGSNFISLDEIPKEGIMSDHIHLNSLGHEYVLSKLITHQ